MLSFFGYGDITESNGQAQGTTQGQHNPGTPHIVHAQGQPAGMLQAPYVQETYVESPQLVRESFVEGPQFTRAEPQVTQNNNMVRYLGSTTDGDFMQNNVGNGYTVQPAPMSMPFRQPQPQQNAPYPYSTYTVPQQEPLGPKKVVSERVITRDELFSTGNLVEAPQQKTVSPPEVSPLMMDFPGNQMMMVPGGSVRMNAVAPVQPMPMQMMPVPMGGSVQLSASPFGGGLMVPGGSVQMSAQASMGGPGPVIMAPQGGSFTAAPPPGALPRGGSFAAGPMPFQPMGGSMQMSSAPMVRPMGGSITMPVARPTGITIGPCGNPGCGNSGTNQCSQCGVKAYCSVDCQQKDWPAHKAICKKMAAERTQSLGPQVMPQGGAMQMPQGGAQFPQMFGGSITMPVASPTGINIGPCGNAGCSKSGTNQCSQCGAKAYCSVECQQKDWPNHKAGCKKIAAERKGGAPAGMPPGGGGSFVRPLVPQMGGHMGPGNRIQIPVQQQQVAMPQGGMMMPQGGGFPMAVPGGSFTAAPMQPMPMGGSFSAAPMGGSFTAAPMPMPGSFMQQPMQPMQFGGGMPMQQPRGMPQPGMPLQGPTPSMRVEMA